MRFERILGILVSLLAREKTSALGLAQRHGVSVRTIYRDLRSLEEAGIPLTTSPGPGGGVDLVEGFTLDRQLLRPEELDRLRGALAGLSRVFPDEAVRSGQRKLDGLTQGKTGAELLYLDLDAWSGGEDTSVLGRLAEACRHSRVCRATYRDGNGQDSQREVEPLTLVWRGGRWYLFAWCRRRADYRLFRVGGFIEVAPTGERCQRRSGNYSTTLKAAEKEAPRREVTVKFAAAKAHLAPRDQALSAQEHADGSLTLTLTLRPEEMYETCARWGAFLEVLAPPELRESFRTEAQRLHQLYFSENSENP